MKSIKIIALLIFLFFLNSCENNSNDKELIICTQNFVYGLVINLTEKTTANPINGNIIIVAKYGNYEETLENSDPNMSFYGAGERKGTYIVTVTTDNYKTFVSEPIIVTADECHVTTEKRTFELELK